MYHNANLRELLRKGKIWTDTNPALEAALCLESGCCARPTGDHRATFITENPIVKPVVESLLVLIQ